MPINVWDYRPEYEAEHAEILAAVEEVFRSGRLILGEKVKAFEQRFAQFIGVEHGIGVNSGTDALFLGLKAIDIGPGDEVITVANTAVPTVAAIVSTGATPKFVDIDPKTMNLDTTRLKAALTPKTKAIVAVEAFGHPGGMLET